MVLDTASRHQRERHDGNYDARLLALRDDLVEERLAEDRASILEQMERLARLAAQRSTHSEAALDMGSPYFGHMRVEQDDGSSRDILIGKQTWVRDGVRVVDWRNAPISRLFYQRREGEDFDIVIAGRVVEGELRLRRTLTIRDGQLVRVATPDAVYVRMSEPGTDGGSPEWIDTTLAGPALRGGSGAAARPEDYKPVLGRGGVRASGRGQRIDKHLPEIASLLDPEQFRLITRPDSGLVVIQGSAGSGKTTVALHRVAYLAFRDSRRFSGSRTLVVVFSPALTYYISQVLPALGVQNVAVRTYETWVREHRRRLLQRVPDVYAEDTPAVVARFKLHSALVEMLEEGRVENPELDVVELFEELFTNRGWIGRMAERAPGAFSTGQLDSVHRWCADMHFVRVEGGGHRDWEVPSIDREDDTILLYLYQRIRGPIRNKRKRRLRYGQLVVDEAQDLSPIELKVLLGVVDEGGAVTLAGDTAQRVVEDNDFQDWSQVLAVLGLDHVSLSPLRVSYRSTASIMRLARDVLGPLAPEEPLLAPRDGAPPELLRFPSRGEAMTFLADALRDLTAAEPKASIALLARYPWQADYAYGALSRGELAPLARVADHDFSFRPGIEITDIRQAKGLEFDYVVLLDVDADTYPRNDSSRHLLHVGVTRAAHQVWAIAVGSPSPLVPDWVHTTRL